MKPDVSVIIPARNEELNIGRCLASLVSQYGVAVEIFVIDDHSEDRTSAIAAGFPDVTVLSAPSPSSGVTGKVNAMQAAIPLARGDWLLFTDADTFHLPGSLRRSLNEAFTSRVGLLSYSPLQEIRSFWEKAVQPVVFAELNRTFRYSVASDSSSSSAAANGQYILVARNVYEAIGGHLSLGMQILEDVELAKAAKRVAKVKFRYAPDAVTTRMYRNRAEIVDGWTKNLAILFPNVLLLGLKRAAESAVVLAAPLALAAIGYAGIGWKQDFAAFLVILIFYAQFNRRLRKAGVKLTKVPHTLVGLPFYSYLLLRSWFLYRVRKCIKWKGRTYPVRLTPYVPRNTR